MAKSVFFLAVFLLFFPKITPQQPSPAVITLRLQILSPPPDSHNLSGPVIPISVSFTAVSEPPSSGEGRDGLTLPPDHIQFSVSEYNDLLPPKKLTPAMISTANLQLCLHVVGTMRGNCVPGAITEDITTGGSLFRVEEGKRHRLVAWLRPYESGQNDEFAVEEPWKSDDHSIVVVSESCFTVQEQVTYDTGELSATTNNNNKHFSTSDRSRFFDQVYNNNVWSFPDWEGAANGGGVRSGFGSTLHQTVNLREFLESFIREKNIKSVVDIPCGDLHWITNVNPVISGNVVYFGGDVSKVVIDEHKQKYADSPSMNFDVVDAVDQDLVSIPGVTNAVTGVSIEEGVLIIVRHLMFHLNEDECFKVLENIESLSRLRPIRVMLSTHLIMSENQLEVYPLATGHKINLFKSPFCLEDPEEMFSDGVRDLYAGVWRVQDGRGLRSGQNCDGRR